MAYKVALTGGIASGKTFVSDQFATLGVTIIDADIVSREVVAPNSQGLDAIKNYFGSEVINSNGTLDRNLLRSIVFEDEQERQWLNNLLHPLIREKMRKLNSHCNTAYSVNVIPLLFESNQSSEYDRVLIVDCDPKLQLKRLLQRDQSSLEQAQAIIDSQATREQRLSIADDIIDNSQDLQYMQHQVIKLHKQYLSLAKDH